jgi:hypothetical protein
MMTACAKSRPETYNISGYARILDESVNMDLENVLMKEGDPVYELNELMKEAIIIVIEQTGGYDPKSGELIYANEKGRAIKLLTKIDFFQRLDDLLNELEMYPKKYEYVSSGTYLIAKYWPDNSPEKLTNGEVLMGLAISHNKILTSTLIK